MFRIQYEKNPKDANRWMPHKVVNVKFKKIECIHGDLEKDVKNTQNLHSWFAAVVGTLDEHMLRKYCFNSYGEFKRFIFLSKQHNTIQYIWIISIQRTRSWSTPPISANHRQYDNRRRFTLCKRTRISPVYAPFDRRQPQSQLPSPYRPDIYSTMRTKPLDPSHRGCRRAAPRLRWSKRWRLGDTCERCVRLYVCAFSCCCFCRFYCCYRVAALRHENA